jgi:hypothetical protein
MPPGLVLTRNALVCRLTSDREIVRDDQFITLVPLSQNLLLPVYLAFRNT